MRYKSALEIEVKDSLLDPHRPDSKTVFWMGSNEKPLYNVWMFLEGPDLPYVDEVTYILHPTFSNRIRRVKRSAINPNCELIMWAWGAFTVEVEIRDKDGMSYQVSHSLTFQDSLKTPGITFEKRSPDDTPQRPSLRSSA